MLNVLKIVLINLVLLLAALAGVVAQAKDGSNSGGGGNLEKPQPVDVNELREFMNKVFGPAKLFFNSIEPRGSYDSIGGFSDAEGKDLAVRLYKGKTTIYDVLRNADIDVRNDRACVDPDGKDADASAHLYDSGKSEICFSIPRLAPGLYKHDFRKRILALAAHEYSHILGSSEPEAKSIERYVNSNVIYDPSTERLLESMADDINYHAYTLMQEYRDLIKLLNQRKLGLDAICHSVMWPSSDMGRVEEVYRRTWALNLSMFDAHQEGAYWTAWQKLMNTYTVCNNAPMINEISGGPHFYKSPFRPGETQLPIKEFMTRKNENGGKDYVFDVVVRRVDQIGDLPALKAELQDYIDLMKVAFPNPRPPGR